MKKEDALITWKDGDGKGQALAFSQLYSALQNYTPPFRSTSSNIYKDAYQQNISIRDEYARQDYDNYRPGERKPTHPREIMLACSDEYENNGIVHNIIDLMGDFASQGIELNHPVKRIENLYRDWFKRVQGYKVTERLANYACRLGTTVCLRETAKVPVKTTNEMQQTVGSNEVPELARRELPWGYTFLNPVTLEILGEELMPLTTLKNPIYSISIPRYVTALVNTPNESAKEVLKYIPTDIANKIRKGARTISLDPTKVRAIHYKKDDWKAWATPLVYCILDDLHILKKMKQADLAALDGAISQIRIWKLGNIEAKIIPSEAAINRLAEILMQNMGGGILDLIWGPDLEYKNADTTLHHFLGETKYVPTLNRIFAGLGIPPLFSGSTSQGSFTNNFIAIKTLIERLNYIRRLLIEFWEFEIKLVQKALNLNKPATLSFDKMTLNDESSVLTLIKDLADRNFISMESLQERVGANPEIEKVRLKREEKARKKGTLPPKLGPFSSTEENILKAMAQMGVYAPSEFGIELQERKAGEKTPKEVETKFQKEIEKSKPKPPAAPKGVAGQGRPKAKKDAVKRKAKTVTPRKSSKGSFLNAFVWAEEVQAKISDIATPIYLETAGKKNLRQLKSKEFTELEDKKFAVLCNVNINEDKIEEKIKESLNSATVPEVCKKIFDKCLAKYIEKTGEKEVSIERRRTIQSGVYALLNSEKALNETDNINNGLPTLS